ncbi:MAG: virulence-associated E family protein, partial [Acidobacteriota bacterium]
EGKVAWNDYQDTKTAEWLQHQGIHVPVNIAGQAVQAVAVTRRFHPVRQYLDSLKWDGIGRIDDWLTLYLGAEPGDYSRAVGARWLTQAVARIYQPGCKADCCLILEGAQGIKKSMSLRTLAEPWFTDEIAELGTKDASLQTFGVWVIELAELDSLTRAEAGKIKAFMSRATDRFRPPYGKRVIDSPRQCVFAGTVNLDAYLRDETGGRRFWPVRCGEIHAEELARDRNHVWAEAVARYRSGGVWWLETAELNHEAEQEQASRYDGDPWQAPIGHWAEGRGDVTVEQVLEVCLEKPKAHWLQPDKNRIARCLRALGWERFQQRTGDNREWRYRRKQA